MNEVLYLFGPLGCVAMVAIAAVVMTRAGRGSPPPAGPEVRPSTMRWPGCGRTADGVDG